MTRAFGYLRVSGQGQVDGHGFERQREAIEAFAVRADLEVVRYFKDTHTGTAEAVERPGFQALVQALNGDREGGVKSIVVERVDRLGRSVVSAEHAVLWLAAHGFELLAADTGENVTEAYRADPMKRALVQMQAVFAELEKSMLVKKLRLAREKVRAQGEKCEGKKAIGEADDVERQAVCRVRELRRKLPGRARMGYGRIARALTAEGFPTRFGRPWSASTVRNVIQGPVYDELGQRGKV